MLNTILFIVIFVVAAVFLLSLGIIIKAKFSNSFSTNTMQNIFFLVVIIVAVAVLLLSVGIIIKGKFPNSHVSHNPEMRRLGIHCVQQQDREARKAPKYTISASHKSSES